MKDLSGVSGWVVMARGARYQEYFVAAIADPDEAIAAIARHLGDASIALRLGSQLNAVHLAARALKQGDIYQIGMRRRVKPQPKAPQTP